MKKLSRLLALLLVALMLIGTMAFATETTGISVDDLDAETYSALLANAQTLAAESDTTAQADTVLGMGMINADETPLCETAGGTTLATLASGAFVTVYEGDYSVDSVAWVKAAYEGQTGYIQADLVALCTCENVELLERHTDSCPEKSYIKYVCNNYTAQEIYEMWDSLSEEGQVFALTYLSWGQQTKLDELNALLGDDTPLVDSNLSSSAGGSGITLSGSLPEGTELEFDEVSSDTKAALTEALDLADFDSDSMQTYAFDIGLNYNGAAYQPEDSVSITLSGIGAEEQGDDYMVKVFHFLDTAESVAAALADGSAKSVIVSDTSAFAAEIEASGIANTVYYTELSSLDGDVAINGTSISFAVDSFSTFYVAAGNTKASEVYGVAEALVVLDSSDAKKGTTKIYAMPGMTITFYASTKDGTTKGTWSITTNAANLDISKVPTSKNHECTIIVPGNAATDTGKYTRLKVEYTISGYSYTRYADIYVASLETVVSGAINSQSNDSAQDYTLFLLVFQLVASIQCNSCTNGIHHR